MALPFLVLYLTENRGLGSALAGATLGVYGLGGLGAGLVAGWVGRSLGATRVMQVSLVSTGAALARLPVRA